MKMDLVTVDQVKLVVEFVDEFRGQRYELLASADDDFWQYLTYYINKKIKREK